MSEENNYTIWGFLKRCHERGLIYRGYDSMPWCPRCGVGISQMEMNEGYRNVAHKAVFVRFPIRGRQNENLLIWTTTPWTLTSNVGAAVNPELSYLRVKQGDQIYYLGKGAFTAKRKDEEFKNKVDWIEGVPKLKTLEQKNWPELCRRKNGRRPSAAGTPIALFCGRTSPKPKAPASSTSLQAAAKRTFSLART
jgi:isoleucyl-tRNA synthetase